MSRISRVFKTAMLLSTVFFAAASLPLPTLAQDAQAKAGAARKALEIGSQFLAERKGAVGAEIKDAESPAGSFKERFEGFKSEAEGAGKSIDDAIVSIDRLKSATPEEITKEVVGKREMIASLLRQIEPGGELMEALVRYRSNIAANLTRIESERKLHGDEDADSLLSEWKALSGQLTAQEARLHKLREDLKTLMSEFRRAENFMAERLILARAQMSLQSLTLAVNRLGGVLKQGKSLIHEFRGSAGS